MILSLPSAVSFAWYDQHILQQYVTCSSFSQKAYSFLPSSFTTHLIKDLLAVPNSTWTVTCDGVGFIHKVSSTVMIRDAMTWSTEKKKREVCESCFGNWTVLLCWTGLELCTRDGWLAADPQRSQLHAYSLFLSLDLGCYQTWSTKKQREVCEKYFGIWTVLLHRTDLELCTRDGWLITNPLWCWFHP